MRFFKSIICFFFFAYTIKAQNIYTAAGNGTSAFSGDGGPATLAQLIPDGITIDAVGNIYFADAGNHCIRKINSSGIISTIAGTGGSGGFSGDGGPALSAQLKGPRAVALDASGNIYFTDQGNFRIRKINTSGIITTVAGTVNGYSGDGGPATSAKLGWPWDIKIDAAGNIIFSDYGNSCIRKIDNAGIITTIIGNGTPGNSGDGGAATYAQLNMPIGITFDLAGNLFITSGHPTGTIRKVNTSGIINSICGTGVAGFSGDGGPAASAQIYNVNGITSDGSGSIYFCDEYNYRIRKINSSGIISTIVGIGTNGYSGDGGLATLAQIKYPTGIALDPSGNVYFSDGYNYRIRIICTSNCFSGINSLTEKGSSLLVYPNPTSNKLFLESEQTNFQNSEIEIINYLGQTILKTNFKNQIDVSGLANGFYTLLIKDNSGSVITKKFVKE